MCDPCITPVTIWALSQPNAVEPLLKCCDKSTLSLLTNFTSSRTSCVSNTTRRRYRHTDIQRGTEREIEGSIKHLQSITNDVWEIAAMAGWLTEWGMGWFPRNYISTHIHHTISFSLTTSSTDTVFDPLTYHSNFVTPFNSDDWEEIWLKSYSRHDEKCSLEFEIYQSVHSARTNYLKQANIRYSPCYSPCEASLAGIPPGGLGLSELVHVPLWLEKDIFSCRIVNIRSCWCSFS